MFACALFPLCQLSDTWVKRGGGGGLSVGSSCGSKLRDSVSDCQIPPLCSLCPLKHICVEAIRPGNLNNGGHSAAQINRPPAPLRAAITAVISTHSPATTSSSCRHGSYSTFTPPASSVLHISPPPLYRPPLSAPPPKNPLDKPLHRSHPCYHRAVERHRGITFSFYFVQSFNVSSFPGW